MSKEPAAEEAAKLCTSKTDMDEWKSKYDEVKRERDSMEVEIGNLKIVVSEAERLAATEALKRRIVELEHGSRRQHPRITPPSDK
ncbi:hypothetical protein L5515_013471 [Caenorhabditis briggsae]|uniref:Uncharacterized protein n=1 Tax=Caenorhabditis briggsae TaxID=6238 RepID=A0AAE9EBE9_CAEBR|nr:hypothetical protein L5515_013471 [Caenorhabditis briggsae]